MKKNFTNELRNKKQNIFYKKRILKRLKVLHFLLEALKTSNELQKEDLKHRLKISYSKYMSFIDKAIKRKVVKKNTGARRKSKMYKLLKDFF